MSVGIAIKARLNAISGVTSLVGSGSASRIYPLRLPQGVTYPAIRYQKITAQREHVMGQDTGEVHATAQIDCYATTYAGAVALAAAVIGDGSTSPTGLSRWGGTAGGIVVEQIFLENDMDIFEPEDLVNGVPGVYRAMLEFMVHYAE